MYTDMYSIEIEREIDTYIHTRYTRTHHIYIYYTVQGRGKRVREGDVFVVCLACLREEVQPLCTKIKKSAVHTSTVTLNKKERERERETGRGAAPTR